MREYGQIQCSFWTDPEIQGLSDQGRVLACYLLTGPHSNGLGCYRIPDGYIQADFGWTQERVSKGFAELFQIGFCERCETTQFVLIPKFLRWNPTANPKVAAAREKEFNAVPKKATFYQRLIEEINQYGRHLSEPFANRIETLSKQEPTRPNPEPDPKGKGSGAGAPVPLRKNEVSRPDDIDEQTWSDFLAHRRQKKAKLTPTAWKAIRKQLDIGAAKGHDPNDMLSVAMAAGWQGFEFEWFANRIGKSKPTGDDARNDAVAAAKEYRRARQ